MDTVEALREIDELIVKVEASIRAHPDSLNLKHSLMSLRKHRANLATEAPEEPCQP